MSRLRPLSESECYARLYGGRDQTVEVIRGAEPTRPGGGLLGEQLRRLFEEQLRAEEPGPVPEVEAA